VLSFGLGVAISDFNNDGWQDIYVSNDYNEEDYLYINNADGTFSQVIKQATSYNSLFSMGSDATDVNNDGLTDIITLDMLPEKNHRIKMTSGEDNYKKYLSLLEFGFHKQFMRNMLHINMGNNTEAGYKSSIPQFKEVGQFAGISNTDWSWSALFVDADLDGHKDLFITNGYERDYTNMDFLNYTVDLQTKIQTGGATLNEADVISKMPSIKEHNYIFKNNGQLKFIDKSYDWGFGNNTVSAGAVYADLDNDGDQELIINNMNQKAQIYQSNAKTDSTHFVSVHLKEKDESKLIGARVKIFHEGTMQMQEFQPVRGFQSCLRIPLNFGLGNYTKVDSAIVIWSDGNEQKINIHIDKITIVEYSKKSKTQNRNKNSYLSDYAIEAWLPISENSTLNDFDQQALLPYMLSFDGPNISASRDNSQVFIGGTTPYLFDLKNGKYQKNSLKITDFVSSNIFVDIDGDNLEDLMLSHGRYDKTNISSISFYKNNGNGKYEKLAKEVKLENKTSIEHVAHIDYDKDGDEDLFLTNRVDVRNFPNANKSVLLTNDGKGNFVLSASYDLGMVTDVKVADIDNNGYLDLIFARDFSTIAIMQNMTGKLELQNLRDVSQSGCWNNIFIMDVNEDGKLDIIGGNMGLNHQLQKITDKGLKLYNQNFSNASKSIPILTYFQEGREYVFAARDELASQIPFIKKKFNNYEKYAKAEIHHIFESELNKNKILKAEDLESSIFLNNGQTFTKQPLGAEANFFPIYAIEAADINGDGKMDLLLGGNNSKVRVRIGEMNASALTVMKNMGKGSFEYIGDMGIKGDIRSLKYVNIKEPTIIATLSTGQVYQITKRI
jgi:hypothetical protein